MALVICSQGHYFDNKKNDECPMCRKLKEGTIKTASESINSQKTVAGWQIQNTVSNCEISSLNVSRKFDADEERTIGFFAKSKGNDFVTGWLVCVAGPERGRDYRLHHGYNNMGRGIAQDIFVAEDPEMARDGHCTVVYDHKNVQFLLMPLKGNLVYFNDKLLETPIRLENGDRFKAGGSEFELIVFCRKGHTWDDENCC